MAERPVDHLLLDRVGEGAVFFGVADVVVGDEVGHAMVPFLRVEFPAHFFRA